MAKRPATTLIVVLNWNSKEMTADCLSSLLAMRDATFDTVVIDNGSQDGSVDFLHQCFPEIQILANARNVGFAAGCNIGMRMALRDGYDYVLLMNNDTIVAPDLLSELLRASAEDRKAGVLSPKIYFFDPTPRIWWAGGTFRPLNVFCAIPKHIGLRQEDGPAYNIPKQIDWATGCSMLIRCETLAKIGLFDEKFFGHAEDLDLSLRVRKTGYSILFVPSAKLWHKEGIDYRKNSYQHVRCFLGSRNLLWVMRRHLHPAIWPVFLPSFLMRYILPVAVRSMAENDLRSALALIGGIVASFRHQSASSSSRYT